MPKADAEVLAKKLQGGTRFSVAYPEGWETQAYLELGSITKQAENLHRCDRKHTAFGVRDYRTDPIKTVEEYIDILTKPYQEFYALWGKEYFQALETSLAEPQLA